MAYVVLCLLISLKINLLGLLMLLQMVRFPSLWLSNIPSCVYVCMSMHACMCVCRYYNFFVHSSISIFLGCSHITVNNAAMNMRVHISFKIHVFVFFRKIPKSEISQSYYSSVFLFWGIYVLAPIVVAPIYISPMVHRSSLPPHPHQHLLFLVFLITILTNMRW